MPLIVFASRLKELRTKHELKADEFANVGISRRMIFNYEAGDSSPTLEKLEALADVFGVAIDYLVGRTDDPQSEKFKKLSDTHNTPTPSLNSSITKEKGKKVL